MKNAISCALIAALALLGMSWDSARWATPLPLVPHDTITDTLERFENEPQSIYHFSGHSDVLHLTHGKIILNETSIARGAETFEGGYLTVDYHDITSFHYEYSVTTGDTTYVFDAGTEGTPSDTDTFSIVNKNMGTMSASDRLFEHINLTASDLADTLTLTVTTTHLDGTQRINKLPLTIAIECQ